MTKISKDYKKKVNNKIVELQKIVKEKYNKTVNFSFENIIYDLDGKTAGIAIYSSPDKIRLNTQAIEKYPEEMLNETLPHEFAHIVAYRLFSSNGHDKKWKRVMRDFGLSPERCHSFDLQPTRTIKTYEAVCNCSETTITKIRRNKMLKGHRYFCKLCETELKLKDPEEQKMVANAPKPERFKVYCDCSTHEVSKRMRNNVLKGKRYKCKDCNSEIRMMQ